MSLRFLLSFTYLSAASLASRLWSSTLFLSDNNSFLSFPRYSFTSSGCFPQTSFFLATKGSVILSSSSISNTGLRKEICSPAFNVGSNSIEVSLLSPEYTSLGETPHFLLRLFMKLATSGSSFGQSSTFSAYCEESCLIIRSTILFSFSAEPLVHGEYVILHSWLAGNSFSNSSITLLLKWEPLSDFRINFRLNPTSAFHCTRAWITTSTEHVAP